jgi:hypothetical protein
MLPESDNIMILFGYCGSERARFWLSIFTGVNERLQHFHMCRSPSRPHKPFIDRHFRRACISIYCDAIALANIAAIATLDYNLKMEYLYRW